LATENQELVYLNGGGGTREKKKNQTTKEETIWRGAQGMRYRKGKGKEGVWANSEKRGEPS